MDVPSPGILFLEKPGVAKGGRRQSHFPCERSNEIHFAVVAGPVGDFLDRQIRGVKQRFSLVDSMEDEIFVGRESGAAAELPGKMGGT